MTEKEKSKRAKPLTAANLLACTVSFPTFQTILLFDRAYRDDARCAAKYGKYWDAYKKHVPYKFIPYVL